MFNQAFYVFLLRNQTFLMMNTLKPYKTKYLTEAHRQNSEAAIKQIKKWKKSPTNLEIALKKLRENATDQTP